MKHRRASRGIDEATALTRRSVLGVATGAAVATLIGCGGDDKTPTPTPIVPSGSPAVVVPDYDDPTRWAGRVLRVAAWGGEVQTALRNAVWQPFAVATGCKVQELTTDYAQLSASVGNGQPYADVLLVDEVWAEAAPNDGVVETIGDNEIDRNRFGPIAATAAAVPAYAYALVNAFRRDAVEQSGVPENWTDWWDPNRYDGRRTLPRNAFGSFEFALLADGVEPDKLYPLDGIRAVESLRRISGKIVDLWWDSGLEPVAWLSNERADFAAAWHYRAIAGQRDGRAIDIQWNQGLLVADSWVIANGSPALDVAVDLIAYATTPEVQAALARAIPLGPVTPKSFDLLEPKVAKDLPTAPETVKRLIRQDRAWWAAHKTEANEQFNCWLLGGPCLQPAPTGTTSS
ncbi:MAG: putative spermidine/putrescine transport system substrate-binding protein [Thermomicrobiales bacterium]|jgi:putative spermidine/putrescine transport system substrate-binding protein|nr:putative spermidine/putrescine transport system substrate-binding protein [Thermomicrobiales bacterium]MEA2528963.1 putative spermidine/putrescine transport system substrate-binding protein [Thermomicrobiales bacterium]MEA2585612.1 putative spermidine/putrescine transport system substrate-binding protein [Thermomicrobiales bacterium]